MEDIIYISPVKDISFIEDIIPMSVAADIIANPDLRAHGFLCGEKTLIYSGTFAIFADVEYL
jgi:hypothetical protein